MSTCISRHGEFGEHETDADYTCRRCFVFDEAGALAELRQLRHERLTDLHPSVPDGDAIERLRERVEWEIEDYCRIFRTPYSLSPRLQLCADLLGALLASPVREPGRSELDDLRSRLACVLEIAGWDRPYDTRLEAIRAMCDLTTDGMTPKES